MHESDEHAILADLVRRHPELVVRLARGLPGVSIPPGCTARTVGPIIRHVSTEADDIVELQDDTDGKPRLAFIVEIQRIIKPGKLQSWPADMWNERYRRGCDCHVLVMTTDHKVAAWAAEPIRCGASVTHLLVIGPDQIPKITKYDAAHDEPGLAVLSACAYGTAPDGRDTVRAALAALKDLPPDESRLYHRFISSMLTATVVQKFNEELMILDNPRLPPWQYDEDGIPLDGYTVIVKPLLNKTLADERRDKLPRVLASRGIAVPQSTRDRIDACTDAELLGTWFDRALTATTLDEVFAD